MFSLIAGRLTWRPALAFTGSKSYLTNTKGAPFLSRTLRQGWEAKLSVGNAPRFRCSPDAIAREI